MIAIIRHITFVLVFSLPTFLFSQEKANEEKIKPLIFSERSFDFGNIPQGKPVNHMFEVSNNSNSLVTIDNIQASCGCTTPEWSKDPISLGGKTLIKVGYNAAGIGYFEKSISVQYGDGKVETLLIKGNVWQIPEQPATLNKAIAELKAQKN